VLKFLRLTEVKVRVGLAESTLYAKVARGEFPAPVKIGPRASAWLEEEVEKWMADRVAATRGAKSEERRHARPCCC
jgi:prophage regulatory protein